MWPLAGVWAYALVVLSRALAPLQSIHDHPLSGQLTRESNGALTAMPSGPFFDADASNGWEAAAGEFTAHRERSRIGVEVVRTWAQHLPTGASILDLGCGSGVPISEALINDGFVVCGIDASPTLAALFRARFPLAPIVCEPAETSRMFGRLFDGVVSVGLVFLLWKEKQEELIRRAGAALKPGGRLLFSSPRQTCTWLDLTTRRESRSLGADAYATMLSEAGLVLVGDATDEGGNYYYQAVKGDAQSTAERGKA